jgi:hypothetical protein
MTPRSSVVPVVASGTATAVKLLVASLAFAGAYVGVEASTGGRPGQAQPRAEAPSAGAATVAEGAVAAGGEETAARTGDRTPNRPVTGKATGSQTGSQAGAQPGTGVRSVTLSGASARTVPVVRQRPVTRAPAAGTISVSLEAGESCATGLRVRGLVANPDPSDTVLYGWRLERWSPRAKEWKTYLTAGAGFTGSRQVAEWRPHVVANPGWYRVRLSVHGTEQRTGERFQISC